MPYLELGVIVNQLTKEHQEMGKAYSQFIGDLNYVQSLLVAVNNHALAMVDFATNVDSDDYEIMELRKRASDYLEKLRENSENLTVVNFTFLNLMETSLEHMHDLSSTRRAVMNKLIRASQGQVPMISLHNEVAKNQTIKSLVAAILMHENQIEALLKSWIMTYNFVTSSAGAIQTIVVQLLKDYKNVVHTGIEPGANKMLMEQLVKLMPQLKLVLAEMGGLAGKVSGSDYKSVAKAWANYHKLNAIDPNFSSPLISDGTFEKLTHDLSTVMGALDTEIMNLVERYAFLENRDKNLAKVMTITDPELMSLGVAKVGVQSGIGLTVDKYNITATELKECLNKSGEDLEECVRNLASVQGHDLSRTMDDIEWVKAQGLAEGNQHKYSELQQLLHAQVVNLVNEERALLMEKTQTSSELEMSALREVQEAIDDQITAAADRKAKAVQGYLKGSNSIRENITERQREVGSDHYGDKYVLPKFDSGLNLASKKRHNVQMAQADNVNRLLDSTMGRTKQGGSRLHSMAGGKYQGSSRLLAMKGGSGPVGSLDKTILRHFGAKQNLKDAFDDFDRRMALMMWAVWADEDKYSNDDKATVTGSTIYATIGEIRAIVADMFTHRPKPADGATDEDKKKHNTIKALDDMLDVDSDKLKCVANYAKEVANYADNIFKKAKCESRNTDIVVMMRGGAKRYSKVSNAIYIDEYDGFLNTKLYADAILEFEYEMLKYKEALIQNMLANTARKENNNKFITAFRGIANAVHEQLKTCYTGRIQKQQGEFGQVAQDQLFVKLKNIEKGYAAVVTRELHETITSFSAGLIESMDRLKRSNVHHTVVSKLYEHFNTQFDDIDSIKFSSGYRKHTWRNRNRNGNNTNFAQDATAENLKKMVSVPVSSFILTHCLLGFSQLGAKGVDADNVETLEFYHQIQNAMGKIASLNEAIRLLNGKRRIVETKFNATYGQCFNNGWTATTMGNMLYGNNDSINDWLQNAAKMCEHFSMLSSIKQEILTLNELHFSNKEFIGYVVAMIGFGHEGLAKLLAVEIDGAVMAKLVALIQSYKTASGLDDHFSTADGVIYTHNTNGRIIDIDEYVALNAGEQHDYTLARDKSSSDKFTLGLLMPDQARKVYGQQDDSTIRHRMLTNDVEFEFETQSAAITRVIREALVEINAGAPAAVPVGPGVGIPVGPITNKAGVVAAFTAYNQSVNQIGTAMKQLQAEAQNKLRYVANRSTAIEKHTSAGGKEQGDAQRSLVHATDLMHNIDTIVRDSHTFNERLNRILAAAQGLDDDASDILGDLERFDNAGREVVEEHRVELEDVQQHVIAINDVFNSLDSVLRKLNEAASSSSSSSSFSSPPSFGDAPKVGGRRRRRRKSVSKRSKSRSKSKRKKKKKKSRSRRSRSRSQSGGARRRRHKKGKKSKKKRRKSKSKSRRRRRSRSRR